MVQKIHYENHVFIGICWKKNLGLQGAKLSEKWHGYQMYDLHVLLDEEAIIVIQYNCFSQDMYEKFRLTHFLVRYPVRKSCLREECPPRLLHNHLVPRSKNHHIATTEKGSLNKLDYNFLDYKCIMVVPL